LKTPALPRSVGGKHFKTKLFKNDEVTVIMIFLFSGFFSNTNPE